MLLVCPTCEASYQINDGKIGPSGRTVRCKKCATVWFAFPADDATPPESAETTFVADNPADQAPAIVAETGQPGSASEGWDEKIDWGQPDETREAAPAQADSTGLDTRLSAAAEDQPPTTAPTEEPPALENIAARSGKSGKKGRHSAAGKRKWTLPKPSLPGLKQSAPYAAFAACLTLVLMVAAREPLAHGFPALAKLYSAIGLPVAQTTVAIASVRSELSKLDKADVLIVEGELTNRGSHTTTVPPVQISVRDAAGIEVYVWTADVLKPMLGGGETSPFRARLASPPPNGRSVSVRFGQAPADSHEKAAPKKS